MSQEGSRPVYREPRIPPSYNFVQNCQIRDALVCFDSARRGASNHTRASRIWQFWTKL